MSHLKSSVEHVSNGFDVEGVVLGRNLLDRRGDNADVAAQLTDQGGDLLSIAQNFHTLSVRIITYAERTLNAICKSSTNTTKLRSKTSKAT